MPPKKSTISFDEEQIKTLTTLITQRPTTVQFKKNTAFPSIEDTNIKLSLPFTLLKLGSNYFVVTSQVLGYGGFSTVKIAILLTHENGQFRPSSNTRALKIVIIPKEEYKAFEKQVEIEHKIITKLYDSFGYCVIVSRRNPDYSKAYIDMPAFNGHSLDYFKNPMSLGSRMRICLQVAKVARRLHKLGAVHGDLKPQNIIYDPRNNVTNLIDFGGSHISASQKVFRSTASTPGYSSPEVEAGTLCLASDTYSLGITFREFIKNKTTPYESEEIREIFHKFKEFTKLMTEKTISNRPTDEAVIKFLKLTCANIESVQAIEKEKIKQRLNSLSAGITIAISLIEERLAEASITTESFGILESCRKEYKTIQATIDTMLLDPSPNSSVSLQAEYNEIKKKTEKVLHKRHNGIASSLAKFGFHKSDLSQLDLQLQSTINKATMKLG